MAGDVVKRAVALGNGSFGSDAVLNWLADLIRALRTQPQVACGGAGVFLTTEQANTVEINPKAHFPAARKRLALAFDGSRALHAAIDREQLEQAHLDRLASENPIATAFAQALATELVLNRRAAIGNFGVWTIGQKPDLTRFVRFRPRPQINHML